MIWEKKKKKRSKIKTRLSIQVSSLVTCIRDFVISDDKCAMVGITLVIRYNITLHGHRAILLIRVLPRFYRYDGLSIAVPVHNIWSRTPSVGVQRHAMLVFYEIITRAFLYDELKIYSTSNGVLVDIGILRKRWRVTWSKFFFVGGGGEAKYN